jgi:Uma2 family endonuclease
MLNVAESLERFSYGDYKNWEDTVRYELIYGEAYMMSAPDIWHHDMAVEIYSQLREFLKDKSCKPFIAPVDVRLFPKADESDDVVVQPDVFVVCDESKVSDGKACRGAPDFTAEIISPASKVIDLSVKRDLYLKAGVKEYFVIGHDKILVYTLINGEYNETIYNTGFSEFPEIPVSTLPGCVLKFNLK